MIGWSHFCQCNSFLETSLWFAPRNANCQISKSSSTKRQWTKNEKWLYECLQMLCQLRCNLLQRDLRMTNQIRQQFLVCGGFCLTRVKGFQRKTSSSALYSPSPRLFGDNPDKTPTTPTQIQISSASHRVAIVQESATKQAKFIIFHFAGDVTSGKFAILKPD